MAFTLPKISKRTAGILAVAFGTVAAGTATFNKTDPGQFGLRETGYVTIADDFLKPGIHMQIPFLQYTHNYDANTQKIAFNAGGCRFMPGCDSTADQNPLRAELVLSYRVTPDHDKMAFHRWAMEGFVMQDGYWLLTEMINTSANATLGKQTMSQSLNNPHAVLSAFTEDLTLRLAQNNVPVEIESIELKSLNTTYMPSRTVSYGAIRNQTRMPVPPTPPSPLK